MKTILSVKNVSKGDERFSITNVSFSQNKLEKIAIAGETGAGKSSLLRLIAGLLQPDAGELLFEGARIAGPDERLVPGHPDIAYLSQHFELQKSLRVEQVLAYSNTLPANQSDDLFKLCQIDHLLKRRTDQLSGGEKQRVAVCRLLISRPRLLLLDEPYAHLDMSHKAVLKSVVRGIGEKLKITCILVSHDPQDTLSWADKILVMRNGKIIQEGSPESVYFAPVDEYTAGLFGSYNLIERKSFRTLSKLAAFKNYTRSTGAKRVFVRPEGLRLGRKGGASLAATVKSVTFFGGYRHVQVLLAETLLTLRTTSDRVNIGETVYVAVSAKDLHSFPGGND